MSASCGEGEGGRVGGERKRKRPMKIGTEREAKEEEEEEEEEGRVHERKTDAPGVGATPTARVRFNELINEPGGWRDVGEVK